MYDDKIELCYMNTDICIVSVETEDFYKDISNELINGLILVIIVKISIDH